MHRIYGLAIWTAIGIMVVGLSMLFGFWAVLALLGGASLAGAILYVRKG